MMRAIELPLAGDERQVLDRIDADWIAELAGTLVRAGASNEPGPEHATVQALAAVLTGIGAEVELDEVAPGRPNLVARVGSREWGDGVVFLGHSDVVAPGDGWTGDPFEPRRRGDALVGRGTTDMKGGLAAVVAAMAAVHAEDPRLPMTLVCTVDEEADAIGALHYLATTAPTTYAACVVAEPTDMVTITACRGATNLRVEVTGASAHAGKPDEGASAVLAASDVIDAVEADARRLAAAPHPVLGAATWSIGTIAGGHGTSIVPDRCVLTVDRRTLPHEVPEEILAALLGDARERTRAAARPGSDRIGLAGVVEMVMPGFETDQDSPLVHCVRDAVRTAGRAGDVGVWTAACEGGFMAQHHGAPTVVLGPGDLKNQAHQPDECVSVSELYDAARAYALIAMRSADRRGDTPTTSTRPGAATSPRSNA
ncbi:MAG: M20 family metallopeptidase [Nocardioidaceae bacterium]|nr:M20 family metallopeptidase [Nocardioidaceae bacterium]MCL2613657.1 M20 family metallopeptidase [Nocardioidaceae bacterium]